MAFLALPSDDELTPDAAEAAQQFLASHPGPLSNLDRTLLASAPAFTSYTAGAALLCRGAGGGYPRATTLSEHPLVSVDRNIRPQQRPRIDRFVRFLWSDEAQRIFVRYGFRSVREELNTGHPEFPAIEDPFRIADYGGWRKARREIVEAVWQDRVMKQKQKAGR